MRSFILTRSRSYASFVNRHIGVRSKKDIQEMLQVIERKKPEEPARYETLDNFIDDVVPHEIRDEVSLKRSNINVEGMTDDHALVKLREIMDKNIRPRNFIGQGFYGTITPHAIQRGMLESPAWYTPYTPYQSEISQGRLTMLINFQSMINNLTGLSHSNSSLLDEGSAAAEAVTLAYNSTKGSRTKFFVAHDVHPTTIAVVKNRASPLNYEIVEGDPETFEFDDTFFGALLQYPGTDGHVNVDMENIISKIKSNGIVTCVATDLLALCLLRPPGEMGADICVGSSQRFGVPMGFGGPHAAFISVRDKSMMRKLPGRIVGISRDRDDKLAYRLTLQSREQHIRREKASSNICTAQALLANISAAYAIYHGPKGLKEMSLYVHSLAKTLENALVSEYNPPYKIVHDSYFDTVSIRFDTPFAETVVHRGHKAGINIRLIDEYTISVSFDETHTLEDVGLIYTQITANEPKKLYRTTHVGLSDAIIRQTKYLTNPVFNKYHSETEMMRYLYHLQKKDMGLADAMIPLGSCTMKLNSAAEMIPLSWLNISRIHPFAPTFQTMGYAELFESLEKSLASVTGLDKVSLQPNAGATGEYCGLRAIQAYHEHNNEYQRKVCLIPQSAHGTNPASAKMAGMDVVIVNCLNDGYIDFADLRKKLEEHNTTVSAIMITYPSTFGIFEEDVVKCCEMVHSYGAQVYMDGANMNAQVGLTNPGFIGADVVHLNLHKTFCIPHGGGGPGVGPIGVRSHLAPFLPTHPLAEIGTKGEGYVGPVTSGIQGSASILHITWMYLQMMGQDGLRQATKIAILNANYMMRSLEEHYNVSYLSRRGEWCAHEFVIDISPFNKYGITAEDVCKRLIDYSFHGPTQSWPVKECLMIEPTESESKEELDRFIEAMIGIRKEIQDIIDGNVAYKDSVLYHAPHTVQDLFRKDRVYDLEHAVYPVESLRENKFWPTVNRLDNSWGDRNLFCSCDDIEMLKEKQ
jgi:glycine dehydrogenase